MDTKIIKLASITLLLLLACIDAFSQYQVSGKLTTLSGLPVANIILKYDYDVRTGTSKTAITNTSGNYVLNVADTSNIQVTISNSYFQQPLITINDIYIANALIDNRFKSRKQMIKYLYGGVDCNPPLSISDFDIKYLQAIVRDIDKLNDPEFRADNCIGKSIFFDTEFMSSSQTTLTLSSENPNIYLIIRGDFDNSSIRATSEINSYGDIYFNRKLDKDLNELVVSVDSEAIKNISAIKLAIHVPFNTTYQILDKWIEPVKMKIVYQDFDQDNRVLYIDGIRDDLNSAARKTLFRIKFPYHVTNQILELDTSYTNEVYEITEACTGFRKYNLRDLGQSREGTDNIDTFTDIHPNPFSNILFAEAIIPKGARYSFKISDINGNLLLETAEKISRTNGIERNIPINIDDIKQSRFLFITLYIGGKRVNTVKKAIRI